MAPACSDGRVPCAFCGRAFNAERLAKHESICSKLKNGRPAPVKARESGGRRDKDGNATGGIALMPR
ncbi:hypothetical protein KIPB_013124 [Kipferlia bialata]|uniref:C2HC/C3H-type domain-containing protein n=1 Tax=Kipferlia bialata TaxID=797122 RepID=A0A9K3GPA6_9EUKA|nr:hypothetical protein KIPB_013124 [Kipferlia bialata]|eukprot:g13124.t1